MPDALDEAIAFVEQQQARNIDALDSAIDFAETTQRARAVFGPQARYEPSPQEIEYSASIEIDRQVKAGIIPKATGEVRKEWLKADRLAAEWGVDPVDAMAFSNMEKIGSLETYGRKGWRLGVLAGGAAVGAVAGGVPTAGVGVAPGALKGAKAAALGLAALDVYKAGRLLVDVKALEAANAKDPEADLSGMPEAQRVKEFLRARAEIGIRGTTGLGQVMEGALALPEFMVAFMGSKGAAQIGIKAMERAGRGRIAQLALGAATRTALSPTMQAKVVGQTFERMLPRGMAFTPKGHFIVSQAGDRPAMAYLKAFGDMFVENLSEQAGEMLFKPAGRALLSKFPKLKAVMDSLVSEGGGWSRVKATLESAGWNGLLEEWGEERLGGLLRGVLGIGKEYQGADFFERVVRNTFPDNMRDALIELGVLAVPGLTGSAASLFAGESANAQNVRSDTGRPDQAGQQPQAGEADRGGYLQQAPQEPSVYAEAVEQAPREAEALRRDVTVQTDALFARMEATDDPKEQALLLQQIVQAEQGAGVPATEPVAEQAETIAPEAEPEATPAIVTSQPVIGAEEVSKQPALAEYARKRGMITDEVYQQAKRDLAAAARGETPGMFGAAQIESAAKMGAYWVERGFRRFSDWSRQMVRELGEWVRPHLQAIWDAMKRFAADERGFLNVTFNRPLWEVMSGLNAKTLNAENFLPWLKKQPGVTAEDVQWSGVEEWLAKKGKASKAEVLEYLRQNEVQVEEVVAGPREPITLQWEEHPRGLDPEEEWEAWGVQATRYTIRRYYEGGPYEVSTRRGVEGKFYALQEAQRFAQDLEMSDTRTDTKFSQYTLPGGTAYRELLLTLANKPEALQGVAPFRGGHWEESDVLAHVRFNERTDADGKRVLFIEEIQSDWHQKGKKEGYGTGLFPLPEGVQIVERGVGGGWVAWDQRGLRQLGEGNTREEAILNARHTLTGEQDTRVPDAPFKKTWPELAMKRMVRWAAENGFDRIAWTTGEQQFQRWGSEEIAWVRAKNATSAVGGPVWRIHASEQVGGLTAGIDIEGEARARGLLKENTGETITSRAELKRVVGDVLSRDQNEAQIDKLVDRVWARMQTEDAGTSLPRKEGMEQFYDSKSGIGGLVKIANDIGKKFGARAGMTTLETPRVEEKPGTFLHDENQWEEDEEPEIPEARHAVHSLNITPAMTEAVGQWKGLVSEEAYQRALKSLGSGTTVSALGAGQIQDMATIGLYHLERGARTFVAWSRQMVKELGEWIRPHLRAVWQQVQTIAKGEEAGGILPWGTSEFDYVWNRKPGDAISKLSPEAFDVWKRAVEAMQQTQAGGVGSAVDASKTTPQDRNQLAAIGLSGTTDRMGVPMMAVSQNKRAELMRRRVEYTIAQRAARKAQEFAKGEEGFARVPGTGGGRVRAPLAGGTKAETFTGTVEKQMDAWISQEGKAPSRLPNRLRKARFTVAKTVFNQQAALKAFASEADEIQAIQPGENPYKWARVTANYAASKAREALDNGVKSMVTGQRMGPSAREAFDPLGDLTAIKLKRFGQYVAARSARERIAQNPAYQAGALPSAIEAFYRKYKQVPGFEKGAQAWTRFHKSLVAMLAEAGRLTLNSAANVIASFPDYAPLMVIADRMSAAEGGRGRRGEPSAVVKRLTKKGSPQRRLDPLVATMKMTQQFYQAAALTIAQRKIVETAETRGMTDWVRAIPSPADVALTADMIQQLQAAGVTLSPDEMNIAAAIMRATNFSDIKDNRVIVFDSQGKAKWYEFDEELHQAVLNMPVWAGSPLATEILRVVSVPTKIKRMGATGLRLVFGMFRNPARDLATYLIRTDQPTMQAAGRLVTSLLHQGTNVMAAMRGAEGDPVMRFYEEWSGESAQLVGQDMAQGYKTFQEWMKAGEMAKTKGVAARATLKGEQIIADPLHTRPLHVLQSIIGATEKTPRLAAVMGRLEALGYTREMLNAGVEPPPGIVIEALYAGMNITNDFSLAGSYGRVMNKLNAFTNAKLRDLATDWEVAKAHPGRTLLRGTLMVTLPTLALWWHNRDEDWYKEAPPWLKYNAWLIPLGGGKYIPIPRPFLLGAIFASIPEAIFDSAYRKNPESVKQAMKQVMGEYKPGWDTILSDAVEPAMEAYGSAQGWSYFRNRPVVSEQLAEQPAREQAYDYTTKLSKYFGWKFNISPAKLDHAINGYTGGLGTDIANIPQEGPWRALMGSGVIRDREAVTSTNEFYEQAKTLGAEYSSSLATAKQEGREIIDDEKLSADHYRFRRLQEVMGDIRDVYKGETDTERLNQKVQFINGLARLALGKEALGRYPNIFVTDADMPLEVMDIRDKFIVSVLRAADAPLPEVGGTMRGLKYRRRRQEVMRHREEARDLLATLGVTMARARRLARRKE